MYESLAVPPKRKSIDDLRTGEAAQMLREANELDLQAQQLSTQAEALKTRAEKWQRLITDRISEAVQLKNLEVSLNIEPVGMQAETIKDAVESTGRRAARVYERMVPKIASLIERSKRLSEESIALKVEAANLTRLAKFLIVPQHATPLDLKRLIGIIETA